MAATDMRSDGGTQTEDQDAWMGYNHVHLAVNLGFTKFTQLHVVTS